MRNIYGHHNLRPYLVELQFQNLTGVSLSGVVSKTRLHISSSFCEALDHLVPILVRIECLWLYLEEVEWVVPIESKSWWVDLYTHNHWLFCFAPFFFCVSNKNQCVYVSYLASFFADYVWLLLSMCFQAPTHCCASSCQINLEAKYCCFDFQCNLLRVLSLWNQDRQVFGVWVLFLFHNLTTILNAAGKRIQ